MHDRNPMPPGGAILLLGAGALSGAFVTALACAVIGWLT